MVGPPLQIPAHHVAKAGQINLTRQLCHELGEFNITVNNIAPGFVLSNPTTERQWASYGAAGQAALLERIALKHLGTPEDIAHGVLFFASDYAGWISGQVLSVDGGKLEWGSHDLGSIFAQKSNMFSPSFLWMIREVLRFGKEAPKVLIGLHLHRKLSRCAT